MTAENKNTDYKSLRIIQTGDKGYRDLAQAAVCFANAQGGKLVIGIEDIDKLPPENQEILVEDINKTLNRVRSLTFNVAISASEIFTHQNGGQYFEIHVLHSAKAIATTNDGKIYIRIGDQCHAARSEDLVRITTEKDAFQWELQGRNVAVTDIPTKNIEWFAQQIRQSPRVKDSIKQQSDYEIAEHYNLLINQQLTNLGILWLGNAQQRSRLAYPLTVQYIVTMI